MFFRKDAELSSEVNQLKVKIAYLNQDVKLLKEKLEIQTVRIDALMKAYFYGINKDGSPCKKMGRPFKKETT
jgi:hypothetical protein